MQLKQIHHLIRYFIFLAFGAFAGYVKHWNDALFLILIGPPVYLAYGFKKLITTLTGSLPFSQSVDFYVFLLPLTLFYFGLIGFQLKQLWNERGKVRFLSMFVFLVFLGYIHYLAWNNLLAYITLPA